MPLGHYTSWNSDGEAYANSSWHPQNSRNHPHITGTLSYKQKRIQKRSRSTIGDLEENQAASARSFQSHRTIPDRTMRYARVKVATPRHRATDGPAPTNSSGHPRHSRIETPSTTLSYKQAYKTDHDAKHRISACIGRAAHSALNAIARYLTQP